MSTLKFGLALPYSTPRVVAQLSQLAEEAYWDGCLQVFKRDPNHRIIGAKFVGSGNKVVIQPLSIEYSILNDTDLPVEFIDLSPLRQTDLEKLVQEWRDQSNQILNDVEKDSFIKYILKRYKMMFGETTEEQEDKAEFHASVFFELNMSHKDKMPEDILKMKLNDGTIPSWEERKCKQWDREINLVLEGTDLILQKV